MAEIELMIGGHHYMLACGEGEEATLQRLAADVDTRISQQRAHVGNADQSRELLMVALVLADELAELRQAVGDAAAAAPTNDPLIAALDQRAARLTALADRLNKLSHAAT